MLQQIKVLPHHTATEAAALEGTPHTLLPATAAGCATPQLIDTSITPCTVIPTGIVSPHPALTISSTGATHTTLWTGAALASAASTMQNKILSPGR